MKNCRNCGAQLEDDAKFCPVCGTPLNDEQPASASAADQTAGDQFAEKSPVEAQTKERQSVSVQQPSGEQTAGEQAAGAQSKEEPAQKKKSRKLLFLLLGIAAAVIVIFLIRGAVGGGHAADQKIIYEGIAFQVPAKWKLDDNASSDAGLYFYANGKTDGEMMYMVSVPDAGYLLNLFGADSLMDWMADYIQGQTGGETVDAQKVQTAGYDTYVYDVTGAGTDVNGDVVQGGYRIACILNTDNSEMILIYTYGLSSGESDQKVLSDLDYILENAAATSEANAY